MTNIHILVLQPATRVPPTSSTSPTSSTYTRHTYLGLHHLSLSQPSPAQPSPAQFWGGHTISRWVYDDGGRWERFKWTGVGSIAGGCMKTGYFFSRSQNEFLLLMKASRIRFFFSYYILLHFFLLALGLCRGVVNNNFRVLFEINYFFSELDVISGALLCIICIAISFFPFTSRS